MATQNELEHLMSSNICRKTFSGVLAHRIGIKFKKIDTSQQDLLRLCVERIKKETHRENLLGSVEDNLALILPHILEVIKSRTPTF